MKTKHIIQGWIKNTVRLGLVGGLSLLLCFFNLIPVPPLDGSHVLSSLLPAEIGERYRQIGFFGILLVIMLMRLDPFRNFIFTVVMTVRIPYEIFIHQFLFTI